MSAGLLSAQGEALQKQVQRHLGRCLMRIQQFELIAKALAAHADLAGSAPELAAIQSKRIDKAFTASLGTLVKGEGTAFTNLRTLFSADDQEADALDENKLPQDQISFAFRYRRKLSPEAKEEKLRELDTLVALRNRLVHHFMEDFNIFSKEGCAQALQHLHKSYSEIDRQTLQLHEQLKGLDSVRKLQASFMQSPEFWKAIDGNSDTNSAT
ncbi:hypothetical protein [Rhodoferax mekongensis]|uniref:hypothetical protein n=1 Tax=Rhodoferax mekongensis TaxID=3068341 RepID=UPI0028BEE551|nr:hypothetical protein [Rhodoferax sp. TBRC 17199]MDT7516915.1 hypothetical protein [Rhodoferax sp. TBRC 17199]